MTHTGANLDHQVDAPPQRDDLTAPLEATASEPILAPLQLLDHRSSRRSIPRRLAPAGQYLAIRGEEEVRLLGLESTVTHIGRGLGSDIRFEEQRVSRNHAIIVRHGRHARVLDDRSANGTFVNGSRAIATELEHGDIVRFGPVTVQYVEIH